MKALYFIEKGKVEYRDDVPVPQIKDGEALIRVKYAGICGSDCRLYREGSSDGKPLILGHEFVGTIIDSKDDGNVRYKKGDFVTAITYDTCGICEPCTNGRPSICSSIRNCGFKKDGTYAEYVKVQCKNVFPFKAGTSKKVAAITEPLAVALFDLAKSGFRVGQSVLISGGGPIGALIGMLSIHGGASRVVISEINENRHGFLHDLGMKAVNPLMNDTAEKAMEYNSGNKFDVAFEVAGPQSSYNFVFSLIKRGGNIVLVAPPPQPRSIDTTFLLRSQIQLIGVNLFDPIYFDHAVKIIESGVINDTLRKFITDIYPIDRSMDAYINSMDPNGSHMKILIDCDPGNQE
ncbi:MAG: zinc-dependent alcohol dehydrogenase [Christensenellales bacterium]